MTDTRSSTHDQSALPRRLACRKLTLLASVAALAGAVLLAVPGGYLSHPGATPLVAPARAAELAPHAAQSGPRGFADIVENVKGAVMSVRVRMKNAAPSVSSNEG